MKFTGAKPKKAKLVAGKKSYKLTRAGKKWRTKKLSPKIVTALTGKKVKIKAQDQGTRRAPSGPKSPVAPTPTNHAAAPRRHLILARQTLFPAPGADRSGNAAWEAIKGYFLDSTFTELPGELAQLLQ